MACFSKICCSDPRYCKSETIPYCTSIPKTSFPVISCYKFTIDGGKALIVWFLKSLQYSSGLYTKYISFLYKITNIHRLCCRNNKTQDEQDHLDNCYLEHYLMVFHGRYSFFFSCCCCCCCFLRACSKRGVFVCKARFFPSQPEEAGAEKGNKLTQSKSRKCLDLQPTGIAACSS